MISSLTLEVQETITSSKENLLNVGAKEDSLDEGMLNTNLEDKQQRTQGRGPIVCDFPHVKESTALEYVHGNRRKFKMPEV